MEREDGACEKKRSGYLEWPRGCRRGCDGLLSSHLTCSSWHVSAPQALIPGELMSARSSQIPRCSPTSSITELIDNKALASREDYVTPTCLWTSLPRHLGNWTQVLDDPGSRCFTAFWWRSSAWSWFLGIRFFPAWSTVKEQQTLYTYRRLATWCWERSLFKLPLATERKHGRFTRNSHSLKRMDGIWGWDSPRSTGQWNEGWRRLLPLPISLPCDNVSFLEIWWLPNRPAKVMVYFRAIVPLKNIKGIKSINQSRDRVWAAVFSFKLPRW